MSDDLEMMSHARGVVVTTICGLAGIGVGDFGVKDNLYIALLMFTLGLNSDTVLETPGVRLVA